ncbi:hypothetical protein GCM10007854_22740 [Algimonas porphyrae]|uniref:Uncharacterized protein n=1 Tax=Algimonas porphyrae TaxID=1128113 RepID=A0ABQ5V193_9PROT|nr:hypothetical protein GCM10007854_22740 [Algimonas porphyrae]
MVVSEPPGATVRSDIASSAPNALDGMVGCQPTPCSVSLPRKSDPVITVSLDGHDPISFKVTSAVATSATSIPHGTVVAGIAPGSHVVAGRANFLNRIPVGGRVVAGAVLTYGVGGVVDLATGANKNLSPNPVSVYLAPEGWEDEADPVEP